MMAKSKAKTFHVSKAQAQGWETCEYCGYPFDAGDTMYTVTGDSFYCARWEAQRVADEYNLDISAALVD